jgi:hypothetical protein
MPKRPTPATPGQPAPAQDETPEGQPPGARPAFKRYYTPHELERERIRRELAEPYRLPEPQPNGSQPE